MGKVNIAEHKAADADAAAHAARDAAKKAQVLADTVKQKLHDAKCSSNPGCSSLQGYCCPTFNVDAYHLGDAATWGNNLECCGGAVEDEATVLAAEARGYDGFTMVLSMVTSAAISVVSTVAVMRKWGRVGDLHQQLIA